MNLLINSGFLDILLSSWWFVVTLVLLLLAILWMQHMKASKRKRVHDRKHPGINPVIILGMVTVFALVLLALPWYLGTLENSQPVTPVEIEEIDPENRMEIVLQVEGMTCTGCESLIHRRVGELEGVQFVRADHELHETTIVFDKTRVDRNQIVSVIEDAGYRVAGP